MEDKKAKATFINAVFMAVMMNISEQTIGVRKKNQITVKLDGNNRYINLSRYGQKLSFTIYTSGDIDIQISEFCHADYKERIFEYTSDEEKQVEFIAWLQNVLEWIIKGFCDDDISWHVYADYLRDFEDFEEAYETMEKELTEIEKEYEEER